MEASPATMIPPPGVGTVAEQPPPVMVVNQQHPNAGGSHGSVGAVIGVVAAIAVLGIIAGMIGRLCSGRTIMGYGGHFDVESWVETKCSSCVDGHIGPPQPRRPPVIVVPPVWDNGPAGGVDGGGLRNGTPAAGPFPVAGLQMTREMKTGSVAAAAAVERELQAEEEEEKEEERESSEEEQLQHRRRHSHRQEEEEHEHEHEHEDDLPEINENQLRHHHHDTRTAPS